MRIEATNTKGIFNFYAESAGHQRKDMVGSGWVAEILATDPKYRYKRRFVDHRRGEDVWYDLRESVVYEYRGLYAGGSKYAYQKHGGESGFFVIEDGVLRELDEAQVRDILRERQRHSSS